MTLRVSQRPPLEGFPRHYPHFAGGETEAEGVTQSPPLPGGPAAGVRGAREVGEAGGAWKRGEPGSPPHLQISCRHGNGASTLVFAGNLHFNGDVIRMQRLEPRGGDPITLGTRTPHQPTGHSWTLSPPPNSEIPRVTLRVLHYPQGDWGPEQGKDLTIASERTILRGPRFGAIPK